MSSKTFQTIEKYFFLLVILLNTLPILLYKFFPTLDGAAHLYNSNLINNLVLQDGPLNKFFMLNPEPVPNWTGHFILSLFNIFLPAFLAEKILLLFYLVGLPLSFRSLINTISPKNLLFSYLIFPFTYSFVFFLGFYNFSIALMFMFITINYWINHDQKLSSFKTVAALFILITITYFSHLFVFAITLMFLAVYVVYQATIQLLHNSQDIKKISKQVFRKAIALLIASFFPLLLFGYYFFSRSPVGPEVMLESGELVESLKNLRPIIALNFQEEVTYTKLLVYLIGAAIVISVFNRILQFISGVKPQSESKFKLPDFWLVATLIILLLYFTLPDSDGSAGYVSVRLGLMFFLFLILWIAANSFPKWLLILIVGVVLFLHFKLLIYYTKATEGLNKIAIECNNASQHIPANSVVLPLNYSSNWLVPHFSNYLGIDKPVIILENYESSTGYFPVKWNDRSIPNNLFGNKGVDDFSCINWKSDLENPSQRIDFVFLLGKLDPEANSCKQKLNEVLSESYSLVYESGICHLYQLK